MITKEQLLYFFLQGKISLSQYDYKFMANLQTIILANARITSNQAALFDKLLGKYSKQLRKLDLNPEELMTREWKTMIVESTDEYTGASVSLVDGELIIKVPFNKNFINAFRTKIQNNPFAWNKELKVYVAPFSTTALKITSVHLPSYFPSVRYCADLQAILDKIKTYEAVVWNPTLMNVNGRFIVGACPQTLAEKIADTELKVDAPTLFKMSTLGINIDPSLYQADKILEFSASRVYSVDITELDIVLDWMKSIGCETVIVGRGMRVKYSQAAIDQMISNRGMRSVQHMLDPNNDVGGIAMLIQHTSNVSATIPYRGNISKIVVLKDSRPLGAV